MTRTPVNSSALKSIGYDAEKRELEVEFAPDKAGNPVIWGYPNVTPETYEQIMQAKSVGSAFHILVRTSGIVGRRVVVEDDA
jgi:KTSC domain